MNALDAKEIRTLWYHCEQVFTNKSWMPMTWENCKSAKHPLSQILHIPDGSQRLLSEAGLATLQDIAECLFDSALFGPLAGYGDYYTACRDVIADCLVQELMPESGEEFAQMITKRLEPTIDTFVFCVPLLGITLEGTEELRIGPFRVCTPSSAVLDNYGVEFKPEQVEGTLKAHKSYLWLIGSVRGTAPIAFHRFRTAADQLTGFLAMYVGAVYEKGGVGFSIRAATRPEELPNRSSWLSWRESDRSLSNNWKFLDSQVLEVEPPMAEQLQNAPLLAYCFALPVKEGPTELERALLRASIWLDDACHERRYAMRLLKLWICAEIFFSATSNISKSVCEGLVTSLLYGLQPFVEKEKEQGLTVELGRMYDKRSRATHGGQHAHVTKADCEKLSQWICWMLVNLSILGLRGVESLQGAKEWFADRRTMAS